MIKTFTIEFDSKPTRVEECLSSNGTFKLVYYFEEEESSMPVPEIFGSTLILPYLQKTIEYGLMNTDFSWKPFVTLSQIALWVEICSERIEHKIKWKDAEDFWHKKNLRKARSKSINEFGKVVGGNIIESCF